MAAFTLLTWVRERGRWTGGRRNSTIDELLADVEGARGCALAFARVEVVDGVGIADAAAHLARGIDPTGTEFFDPATAARLAELGGFDEACQATYRKLLTEWDRQPRQTW